MASMGEIVFWTMISLIVVFSSMLILILAVTLTGAPVDVESSNRIPVANYGEDQLLSCFLPTQDGARLSRMSVSWVKEGLSGVVFQYDNGAPDLRDQNKVFRGRTQLFPDAIVSGNASLLLRSVKNTDEGVYTCSISASSGRGSVSIHLRTAAYSAPQFTFAQDSLVATAGRWFPKPNITWLDLDGTELTGRTQYRTNSVGVFAVVSTLQPAAVSQVFICKIENDLVVSVSEATVKEMSHNLADAAASDTGGLLKRLRNCRSTFFIPLMFLVCCVLITVFMCVIALNYFHLTLGFYL